MDVNAHTVGRFAVFGLQAILQAESLGVAKNFAGLNDVRRFFLGKVDHFVMYKRVNHVMYSDEYNMYSKEREKKYNDLRHVIMKSHDYNGKIMLTSMLRDT